MGSTAAIYGLAGLELSAEERAFFREARPWGFILFQRNCASRGQVRQLTDELRTLSGRSQLPILIDQEGGRVQRLKPPEWQPRPAMGVFGKIYAKDAAAGAEAARLNAALIARELAEIGITVDCVPCLDVPVPGSHSIIGDRAFSEDPQMIAKLGRVVAEAMLEAGVLPVIKHMPGHGRAGADSHNELPSVAVTRGELSRADFVPFKALSDMPLAMTAHVVFTAIDSAPATLSPKVIREIIREEIGFDGLLMTDDLSMKALGGDFGARTRGALRAGCDVILHCNGDMAEMSAVAGEAVELDGKSLARATAAEKWLRIQPRRVEVAEAERRLKELMS